MNAKFLVCRHDIDTHYTLWKREFQASNYWLSELQTTILQNIPAACRQLAFTGLLQSKVFVMVAIKENFYNHYH